jgi:hypothetical protein
VSDTADLDVARLARDGAPEFFGQRIDAHVGTLNSPERAAELAAFAMALVRFSQAIRANGAKQ